MNAKSYTSTKTYRNLPCAHRQWKNEGHCSFVHGYSREFIFHFACEELDKHGWVVDFGDLNFESCSLFFSFSEGSRCCGC